jgi:GT2 family glycosyltransferase
VGGKVKITLKASDVREKVAGKGLSKMLSYIVPIKNRAYLFWRNLQSFLHQTSYDFEVVVLDHGSTDNLLEVVGLARSAGIKVRGFRIDVGKCQFMRGDIPHEPPYVAYNVGAKQAEGEVVVLTSPEVINARTNVERIGSLFSDGKSRFALGWIDHAKIEELEKWAGLTVRQIKSLFPEFRKTGAYCREEDFNDHAFFIGAMRRGDYIRIGGMDEEFMDGYLHSGPEFAARCKKAGFEATLFPEVAGIHLEHFRGYQGTGERNRPNWDRWHRWLGRSLANEEREWGMDDYIVDTF